jgi:DNA (cytosine-5)-methyltransferase 1
MRHGSLFSGIGGFDLAAEWMGWENLFHCEWNKFGQKVLKYYWPKAISYHDIKKTDFTIHRGQIDILTGGFPCQPYSAAGNRLGKEDDRHLWPEMLRAIREIQPTWVVGENVLGLVNWNGGLVFHEVQTDLEAEGYEVQPYVLPAVSVNAAHRRDRVWFVGYSRLFRSEKRQFKPMGFEQLCQKEFTSDTSSNGLYDESTQRYNSIRQDNQQSRTQLERTAEGFGNEWSSSDTCNKGLQRGEVNRSIRAIRQDRKKHLAGCIPSTWEDFPTVSPIYTRNDGFSDRLDLTAISEAKWRNESIKASGNAIVPQVVLQIFKAIEKYNDSISDQ